MALPQGRTTREEGALPVLWLGEDGCDDTAVVGGKAAHLSRLMRHFRVPDGFCLSLAEGELGRPEEDGLTPALRELVTAAYERLGERVGRSDPPVAVRSSALDEDSAGASFAGQHETYLNVTGAEAVAEAVARCWASARTERALEYRRSHGLEAPSGPIPVLVQSLVLADASGVVFSVDPVSGDHDHVVINASWGLGESVVAGSVNPDTFRLRRADLSLEGRQIASKERMTVAVPGGTEEVGVPWPLRGQPAIDDGQATEMARVALRLEDHFGWPVDMECCWAGGELYTLQCRAVTALPGERGDSGGR